MDYTAQQSSEIVRTYIVEEDPSGRAKCQMCSQKIAHGSMRMGKLGVFSTGFKRHQQIGYRYFHVDCLFKKLKACRLTTKVLESSGEIEHFDSMPEELRAEIELSIQSLKEHREKVKAAGPQKRKVQSKQINQSVDDNAAMLRSTSSVSCSADKLRILYTNADVLTKDKMTQLNPIIQREKPDIIMITEINPKTRSFTVHDYPIPDFVPYSTNVAKPGKRGVCLYVHQSLETSVEQCLDIGTDFEESVWCSIKLKGCDNLLLGVIYRSESQSTANTASLNALLKSIGLGQKFSHKCVVGDFNYRKINWSAQHLCGEDSEEEKFLDAVAGGFWHQHVKSPTRARGTDTPNLLDLVLTNELDMVDEVSHMSPLGNSDHQVLLFDLACYINWSKPV